MFRSVATTVTFDALGRPTSECRPGNQCRTTSYGDGINPTATTRPGPTGTVTVTTEYGDRGLPMRQYVYGDSVEFFYDAFGRRTAATNRSSRLEWMYDGYGRLTCERELLPAINDTSVHPLWGAVVAWHDYDRAGRRVKSYLGTARSTNPLPCEGEYAHQLEEDEGIYGETNLLEPATWPAPHAFPAAADSIVPRADTIRYTFDHAGNLTSLFHRPFAYGQSGTPTWTWQYDAKNRVSQLGIPTASPGPSSVVVTNRYTDLDDLRSHSGGAVLDSLEYDPAGRVTTLVHSGQVRRFSYDLRGRLDTERVVSGSLIRRNQYDALGNITDDSTWTYAYETGTTNASYGRLLSRAKPATTVYYAYDGAGSTSRTGSQSWVTGSTGLTAAGDTEMEYDRWGRMVLQRTVVADAGCASAAPTHTEERKFSYDALGRRVTAFSTHLCAEDIGYVRYWWLDDHVAVKIWNERATGVDSNNVPRPDSAYADDAWPQVSGNGEWYVYGPGTDQVLGMHNGGVGTVPTVPSGTNLTFLSDYRGSIVRTYCTVNASSGGCGSTGSSGIGIDYTAYGSAGAAVAGTPGYNGLESNGGLVYMRNRWYDPNSGRFTQADPIGYAGGVNLYAYAGNDPVTFSDPNGLCPYEGEQRDYDVESCTEGPLKDAFRLLADPKIGKKDGMEAIKTVADKGVLITLLRPEEVMKAGSNLSWTDGKDIGIRNDVSAIATAAGVVHEVQHINRGSGYLVELSAQNKMLDLYNRGGHSGSAFLDEALKLRGELGPVGWADKVKSTCQLAGSHC